MNPSSIDLFAKLLLNLGPWRNAKTWRVAFSGGLDSTVLLHLLAHLAKTESLPAISAIHVHHGLQAVLMRGRNIASRCVMRLACR